MDRVGHPAPQAVMRLFLSHETATAGLGTFELTRALLGIVGRVDALQNPAFGLGLVDSVGLRLSTASPRRR